jgi:branched-chain amino acid transport system permease protein
MTNFLASRRHSGWRLLIGAALLIALIAAPWVLPLPWLLVLQNILGLAVFAVATNLLIGWCGLVSFGQAAFYGIGAYTIALSWLHYQTSFWLSFLAAPLVGGLAAFLVGLVALRAQKLYFALLTLAFSELFYVIAEQQYDFTNGANGIFGAMVPDLLMQPALGYFFTLLVSVLALSALWQIFRSPFGLVLQAIREKRGRAESLGANIFYHQLLAFVISGAFCSLAGALYVVHDQTAYPELLDWVKSGDPVIMSVIGGMYAFAGPIFGAFIYQIAHDALIQYTHDWQLFLGLFLLFVMLFLPNGLAGRVFAPRQPSRTTDDAGS